MPYTTKGSEIMNNFFIVMERDATPNHIEDHTHNGK
jgi:hypothetical protein